MDLGKRIRELREKRGYSQRELARAIGTSGTNLSRIEFGHQYPNANLLLAIADKLEVSIDYLMGRPTKAEEVPDEIRELCELAVEAGYSGDFHEYLKWLAARRGKLKHGRGGGARREYHPSLFPEMTDKDLLELSTKFDHEVLLKLSTMPSEYVPRFVTDLKKLLDYYETKGKIKKRKPTPRG